MAVINIITQLLAYNDAIGQTDNPMQRAVDWTRKIHALEVKKPTSDAICIPPGESATIFDGSRVNPMDGTSILKLSLVSAPESIYRMEVTAGTSGFRTARAPTGIVACNVVLNNNTIAEFDFVGATLTGVVVGDVMRINGALNFDTGPYAFNPLNAGNWKVIAISGTKVQAVRPTGEDFIGVTENVATATADVRFYSSAGLQVGDKIDIAGTFSQASQRTYTIRDVTPTTLDFVSATPLPSESALTYIPTTIVFYLHSKKLVYIEADQEVAVRFNADSSDNNRVTPIKPGDVCLLGYIHKWGDTYKCVIVNKSINVVNVKHILAE